MSTTAVTAALAATTRRNLVLAIYLTRMEFEKRFAGSIGGRLWVFAGPALTITAIWTAVYFGLGRRTTGGLDYGPGLAVALAGWMFFSEAVNTALGSIVASPHLVKKIVFPVALLPAATVMAAFVVHAVLLAALCIVLLGQSGGLSWNILALPFWMICLLILTHGLALGVASLNVGLRDCSAIVPNTVSLLFWLTPIVWPLDIVPEQWRMWVLLNPLAVILEGYRHSLSGSGQTMSVGGSVAFLGVLVGFAYASYLGYRRVRPWFADAL